MLRNISNLKDVDLPLTCFVYIIDVTEFVILIDYYEILPSEFFVKPQQPVFVKCSATIKDIPTP